jgi:[acyl-carrier-protein] S-malonyltransferase
MVSIIGLDTEKVDLLCREAAGNRVLKPVNFNCPGQTVISGDIEACRRATALAPERGAAKAVRLEVAGAFHTQLMADAAEHLRRAIEGCSLRPPAAAKVIANVDATFYEEPGRIAEGLVMQLTSPILWQKCMERLLEEGADLFYEIGPGKVLTGLMRRISRRTQVHTINGVEAIRAVRAG